MDTLCQQAKKINSISVKKDFYFDIKFIASSIWFCYNAALK